MPRDWNGKWKNAPVSNSSAVVEQTVENIDEPTDPDALHDALIIEEGPELEPELDEWPEYEPENECETEDERESD